MTSLSILKGLISDSLLDPGVTWPPPDPDRIPLPARHLQDREPHTVQTYASAREEIEAFQRRQSEDLARPRPFADIQRRKRFHDRFEEATPEEDDEQPRTGPAYGDEPDEGEESWRNAEGERLRDFGVDEDVEFYDGDDVPLAVLLERRR